MEGKPKALLIDSILLGRPGTAMPPWEALLTREEAVWIVEQLQQGLSP
jgi:cytochrome c55X